MKCVYAILCGTVTYGEERVAGLNDDVTCDRGERGYVLFHLDFS